MGYADEMRRVRQELFERHWPQFRPQVTRLIEKQGRALSSVQVDAIALYMAEELHLGKVDRVQLGVACDRLALELLGDEPRSGNPNQAWVTVEDCVRLSPRAYERVVAHVFILSGYRPTAVHPGSAVGLRVWWFSRPDAPPVGLIASLGVPDFATLQRLMSETHSFVVVTPRLIDSTLRRRVRGSRVEIIDAPGLAKLLQKYPVSPDLIS